MIAYNVFTNFHYSDTRQSSLRDLAQLGIDGNVILVQSQQSDTPCVTMYSWFVPGESAGRWSLMKGICESSGHTGSSWDRANDEVTWSQCPVRKSLVELVEKRVPLYTVPMTNVFYSFTYPMIDHNFHLYVQLDLERCGEIGYNEYGNLEVVSHIPLDFSLLSWSHLTLYSLSNNQVHSYQPPGGGDDDWDCSSWDMPQDMSLDEDDHDNEDNGYLTNWATQTRCEVSIPETPVTPVTPVIPEMPETPVTPVIPETPKTPDAPRTQGPTLVPALPPPYSGDAASWSSEYEGSSEYGESSDSDSSLGTTIAEGIPLEDKDEMRDRYRWDETDGNWYTKEEFYEYYGTDTIWDAMHPLEHLRRRTLYWIFSYYGETLSYKKLRLLVDEIIDTY